MRKKDYGLIAKAIRETNQLTDNYNYKIRLELFAERLAGDFSQVNPKFDRQKFLTACGIEQADKRECWTCHKAVSICGHSQPV